MDTSLVRPATTVFVEGVAAAALGGWLFGVVEYLAARMMAPWTFRIGVRVLAREIAKEDAIDLSAFGEQRGRQGELRFRRLAADTWLFYVVPSFRFRLNTPIPLKGTLRVIDGRQLLEARVPLGPLLFMGAWLLGWTAGTLGQVAKAATGAEVLSSIAFGGVGILFAIGMGWISLRLERQRLLEGLSLRAP